MKMLKIDQPATIDEDVQSKLDAFPDAERPEKWDKSKARAVTSFKAEVMRHGMKEQKGLCVWCTLPVGEMGRRTAHRDHIAPKRLYPKWTFHAKNLVIACEYCNGFVVKNDLDTVETVGQSYDTTAFWIVHPYLDPPADHIRFLEQVGNEPGVVVEGLTAKGTWTIENLRLKSPGLTVERAKELLFHRTMSQLPAHFQNLLARATGRK